MVVIWIIHDYNKLQLSYTQVCDLFSSNFEETIIQTGRTKNNNNKFLFIYLFPPYCHINWSTILYRQNRGKIHLESLVSGIKDRTSKNSWWCNPFNFKKCGIISHDADRPETAFIRHCWSGTNGADHDTLIIIQQLYNFSVDYYLASSCVHPGYK